MQLSEEGTQAWGHHAQCSVSDWALQAPHNWVVEQSNWVLWSNKLKKLLGSGVMLWSRANHATPTAGINAVHTSTEENDI